MSQDTKTKTESILESPMMREVTKRIAMTTAQLRSIDETSEILWALECTTPKAKAGRDVLAEALKEQSDHASDMLNRALEMLADIAEIQANKARESEEADVLAAADAVEKWLGQ
jgi:hypothetical protein